MSAAQADVREALAAVSHDIWAHWTRWQFGVCTLNADGSLTIPAALVERWGRQMTTDYAALTEQEKESDREQADKIMAVLGAPEVVMMRPEPTTQEIDAVYADRNRLVLLALTLAAGAGLRVCLIEDPAEPDWPVLAIELSPPFGQVSWHVPRALLDGHMAVYPRGVWDGHTDSEKAARILGFVFGYWPGEAHT